MNVSPFRPIEVLRKLEADYGPMAETVGARFEAFNSLGCEKGRMGDADALEKVLRQIIGPAPFQNGDSSLRLKLSAKADKPVTVEIVSSTSRLAADEAVERAVAAMGGSVSVVAGPSSQTVRLTLPLDEVELDCVEQDVRPQEESASLAGTRILIADDSPTNRLVLEEMLADTKAELVSVNDGKEALDRWRSDQFDLLLLDISMPVMDGVTAIREIRATEQEKALTPTPAIAVTANALVNQVADYLVAGFDTHLAKPFRRKDLMHAILTLRTGMRELPRA